MKKIILFIVVIFMTYGFSLPKKENRKENIKYISEKINLDYDNIEFFYKKKKIPRKLLRLMKLYNGSFKIANPGKDYRKNSNVEKKRLPDKQLNFIIKYKSYWIVSYKHGGSGFHNHALIFQMKQNIIQVFYNLIIIDSMPPKKLLENLSIGKYEFADKNWF